MNKIQKARNVITEYEKIKDTLNTLHRAEQNPDLTGDEALEILDCIFKYQPDAIQAIINELETSIMFMEAEKE